jgi:hypothetical protein
MQLRAFKALDGPGASWAEIARVAETFAALW